MIQENYDEEIEKKLDDLLSFYYKNNFELTNPQDMLNHLLNGYEKTKYPGIYYRIAYLYEKGAFRKLKQDLTIEYYEKAAYEGYIPAMQRLAEIGIEKNQFKFASWACVLADDYQKPYGKYLLAKYYLISSLFDETFKSFFKKGFELMKESANDGCKEAMGYMEKIYEK